MLHFFSKKGTLFKGDIIEGNTVFYYQNPYLGVRFDHTTKNMVKHTRLVKTIGFVECITEALNFDCFSFVVKILNNACKKSI